MMTRSIRSTRDVRRAGRVLWLLVVLAPTMIAAQGPSPTPEVAKTEAEEHVEGPSYGRIMLMFAQSYDDNIFAVPESQHPQSDLVARFGPTFEVGRHTRRLEMNAKYGMAAERYFEQITLNTDVARQEGVFDVDYHASPRTEVRLDGGYVDTQSPRELNLTTLVNVGRARGERLSLHSGIAQAISPVTQFSADYTISNDTLAEQSSNLSHLGRLGLKWDTSKRTHVRLDAQARYVQFRNLGVDLGSATTEAITAGISHQFTPLASVDIEAGPRITGGEVRPDVTASLHYRLQKGEISASYITTQDTTVGAVGFFDVQRVSALLTITPVRRLTLTARPAYARSTQSGQTAFVVTPVIVVPPVDQSTVEPPSVVRALETQSSNVRELEVQMLVRVLQRLSFAASARAADQHGTFAAADDPIRTRYISLTTVLTLP